MASNLIFTVDRHRFCLNDDLLQDRSNRLLDLLDQAGRQLSIVFMDDKSMAEYNYTYRDRKGPTNVLSFPAAELHAGLPPELAGNELGDILISVETALSEAGKNDISLHRRITELIIHGTLHLLGYDHEQSSRQARIMWKMEQQLLETLLRIQPRRTTMPHLAINVDHVATIRQARGITEPDPVLAAGICELAGAKGIVVHLREDRRHIQDRDVQLLRRTVKTKLNLEMATAKEIIDIALDIKPDMITLVPEKRPYYCIP